MSDYRPVDCALHSDYERLAITQAKVQVRWRDHEGRSCKTTGTVSDVVTRRGEEFLLVRTEADMLEIRLDRIDSVETLYEAAADRIEACDDPVGSTLKGRKRPCGP